MTRAGQSLQRAEKSPVVWKFSFILAFCLLCEGRAHREKRRQFDSAGRIIILFPSLVCARARARVRERRRKGANVRLS